MAIDINSLFADIIDTPEQRQQKLLQQGMLQGQLLSSGLRGRAAALAPLAQMAGQLGVQRQEDLRRAVQPMLGIDPRSTGEKLQAALANIDTSTPAGLLQAANAVQSVDPIRAATLRQEAARLRKEEEDRAMARTTEELRQLQAGTSIAAAQQSMRLQQNADDRAAVAAEYAAQQAGLGQAATILQINEGARDIIAQQNADASRGAIAQSLRELGSEYELYATGIESNSFDAIDVLPRVAAQELALAKASIKSFKPLTAGEIDRADGLANDRPELQKLLKKGFFGITDPKLSREKFYDLVAVEKQTNPNLSFDQLVTNVEKKIITGIAAPVVELDIEAMARQQAESGNNFDPDAAAAAAAAQLGGQPTTLPPPKEISKEDAKALGYVPEGYTEMTSGILKLNDSSSADWSNGQFVDKQAQADLQAEIQAEYNRINPNGSYNSSAMARAKQIVMARRNQ